MSDLKTAAFRSIIIQEVLRDLKLTQLYHNLVNNSKSDKIPSTKFDLVWLDVHYRFVQSRHANLVSLLNRTSHDSGIASWPIGQPTSSLTHPRMFDFFHTTAESFYFHRMVRSGHLLISISPSTWHTFEWGIMLPWVRCALTVECIAPLGSQWRSSCALDKKPHYRYSGCHHYDMSALNVVLAIAFNFSSSTYSLHENKQFFTSFTHFLNSKEWKHYEFLKQQNLEHSLTDGGSSANASNNLVSPSQAILQPQQLDNLMFKIELPDEDGNHVMQERLLKETNGKNRFDQVPTDDALPIELCRSKISFDSSFSSTKSKKIA